MAIAGAAVRAGMLQITKVVGEPNTVEKLARMVNFRVNALGLFLLA